MLHRVPVSELKGVGPARTQRLAKLGVETVADLFLLPPRRYEDWSNLTPIAQLRDGQSACVRGQVVGVRHRRTKRRNLSIITGQVQDETGEVGVLWFVTAYKGKVPLLKKLATASEVTLLGTPVSEGGRLIFRTPQVRFPSDPGENVVPVYPLTDGLTQGLIRDLLFQAWTKYAGNIVEFIPESDLHQLGLVSRPEALRRMHWPRNLEEVNQAWRRLAFDELLCLQLILMRKNLQARQHHRGIEHGVDNELVQGYFAQLPFQLTAAQRQAINDIRLDMESPHPMRRLLQGDVGSGKTIVALYAMVKAVAGGYQAAFMAPTEVLAEQHFASLTKTIAELGITFRLLTGRTPPGERREILTGLQSGQVQVVVGTHALIQEGVEFRNLGLAVIDEQHRFGVEQREMLIKPETDLLVMTATPIPRTLALTLYGDLDVSIMDQLPMGRKPIDTRWIAERDRPQVYEFLRRQVAKGRQVYVVCPFVEPSEEVDGKAATTHYQDLVLVFPDLKVGLVHGQMPYKDRAAVMENFYNGTIDILVTTTVIEVGVDVPNATVMVIENAERFGLSQLHQLRGRVGRGVHQSYCLLFANPSTEQGRERIAVMRRVSDGFLIAEADLKIRGPGELLGLKQSGFPEMKFADLTDIKELEKARALALEIIGQAQPPDYLLSTAIEEELAARIQQRLS